MELTIFPRVAPPDKLRLWVGVRSDVQPTLSWTLEGTPAVPTYLRPAQSAVPQKMLAGPAKYYTTVVEFSGLTPSKSYRVGVSGGTGSAVDARVKTLPAEIPNAFDRPFNVLLTSCFHQYEDKGQVATAIKELSGPLTPDLTLLMGDQVYLDLPTIKDFPSGAAPLADKFLSDYQNNWTSDTAYLPLLRMAPTASLPDDHEFWNNYPHRSPFIQNSWTKAGRANWENAATALYEAFQFPYESAAYHLGVAQELGDAQVIEVSPLTFFLADGRSRRAYDKATVFTDRCMRQLKAWVADVVQKKRIGVFVTGQSLLDAPASKFGGFVADYAMPNYGDFMTITDLLARIPAGGLPLVLLTGDVHWGRVVRAVDARTAANIIEVITSPASLVTTPVADDWKRMWGAITGNDWPRHSDAGKAPAFLWTSSFGKNYECAQQHPKKGNQVAVLSFSRLGSGVRMQVTYQPVHESPAVRRKVMTVDIPLTIR